MIYPQNGWGLQEVSGGMWLQKPILAMIGVRRLSNGKKLTSVDWRANRLVDLLAKQAAATNAVSDEGIAFLCSAWHAATHANMLLGRVTYAANHCPVVSHDADGTPHTSYCRDATQAPRTYKRKADTQLVRPAAKPKPSPPVPRVVAAWTPPPNMPTKRGASALHAQRVAAYAEACTTSRVNTIGEAAAPATTDATERMVELVKRLRRRHGEDAF